MSVTNNSAPSYIRTGKMHDEGFPCGAATYGGIMQAYGDRGEVRICPCQSNLVWNNGCTKDNLTPF